MLEYQPMLRNSFAHNSFHYGRRGVVLLIAILFLLRLSVLDSFPLIDPSEGRYAEIAQTMALSREYLMPSFQDGTPFWGKPPVYFWAAATSIDYFGSNAFAARFPSFIFSFLTVLATAWLACQRYGTRAGYLSALILTTSLLFFALAGVTLVDTALSMFIVAALAAATRAQHLTDDQLLVLQRSRKILFWLLVGALCVAGAILSKGFIALLVLSPPLFIWSIASARLSQKSPNLGLCGARSLFKAFRSPTYLLLGGLLISVPWHIAAEVDNPGFINYYVLGEHFLRFVQPGWQSLYGRAHVEPHGMIWVYLLVGLLPWSLIAPIALWNARASWSTIYQKCSIVDLGLVAWALVLPLFFTFSRGVMIPYVLPALPACAVIVAGILVRAFPAGRLRHLLTPRHVASMSAIPALCLLVALLVFPFVALRRSDALIMSTIQQLDHDGDAIVTYLGNTPHSAEFYSSGAVLEAEKLSARALRIHRHDERQDYFVVGNTQSEPLERLERLGKLEFVLRTSKRSVFREADTEDLPLDKVAGLLPRAYQIKCWWQKLLRMRSEACVHSVIQG